MWLTYFIELERGKHIRYHRTNFEEIINFYMNALELLRSNEVNLGPILVYI